MKKILLVLFVIVFPLTINAQEREIEKVYKASKLDVQPEYPGGLRVFYKYVNMNFRMPETDKDGTFVIKTSFVVEKDGSMTNLQIDDSPEKSFSDEALRLLSQVKEKWSPGKRKGQIVRSLVNFPITITVRSH